MNKLCLVLALGLTLSACTQETSVISHSYEIPNELQDCKFYLMLSKSHKNLTVVRCPNSATSTTVTYSNGKSSTTRTAVIIDGNEYVRKENSHGQEEKESQ